MNPDVFITIALCAEVALVGIGGGLFVEHEWRQTLGIDADQRQLGRSESLKASTHGARFSDVADAVSTDRSDAFLSETLGRSGRVIDAGVAVCLVTPRPHPKED